MNAYYLIIIALIVIMFFARQIGTFVLSFIFWAIAKFRAKGGCIHPGRTFANGYIYCSKCGVRLGRIAKQ